MISGNKLYPKQTRVARGRATPTKHKIWKETNFPELVETEDFLEQKVLYIHYNPIRKQYVLEPQHWFWSSANPHQPIAISRW